MSLPKIKAPLFSLDLPLTKKNVTYRPWQLREEKILLMAKEAKELKDMFMAIKQVVNNCLVTKLNIDALPLIDVEFLFLHMRSKSVGNKLQFILNDKEDNREYKITIDIDNIKVVNNPLHNKKILLDETTKIGIIMKYPNFDISIKMAENLTLNTFQDSIYEIVKASIDAVYDPKGIYKIEDQTEEEVREFLDSLNSEQFSKINEFFATQPKIEYEIKYKNSKGEEKIHKIESIQDFF